MGTGARAAAVGVVVLVVGLLVAGVAGARAVASSTASDLIPLESAGPSLPVVTGPNLHTDGWSTSGNPASRLAWTAVTIANPGSEPVTITGLDTGGATHDFRAVLSGLVPQDVSTRVIDDTIPAQLDRPGPASLVVPPKREALVVMGFTAACDATDTGFAPSLTLAVSSPTAGRGHLTLSPTDGNWARTASTYACARR